MDWILKIQKTLLYIEEHITENLHSETLAANVYTSSYHFQRMFRMYCGWTLGEYIRMRRMTLAGQELKIGKEKVLDIALKYGYENPDSFAKAFYKFHGVRPSDAAHSALRMFAPVLPDQKNIFADNCNNFSKSGLLDGIASLPNQTTASNAIFVGTAKHGNAYRIETVKPEISNVVRSFRKNIPDYTGGAVDMVMDIDFINLPIVIANFGWRGFAQQIRTADGQVRGFAFYKTEDGRIHCGITNSALVNESFDTGIDIGSGIHNIRISIDDKNIPTLYVDSKKVHTYSVINHKVANVNANTWDIMLANYDRIGTDAVVVELYDISITKPLYKL